MAHCKHIVIGEGDITSEVEAEYSNLMQNKPVNNDTKQDHIPDRIAELGETMLAAASVGM